MADAVAPSGAGPSVAAPARMRAGRNARLAGRGLFLLFVFLVLYGPILLLAIFSFNNSSILSLPWAGFTTRWYHLALQDPNLRQALVNSILVAFIVAPACLVLGTLTAFALTRFRFRSRGAIGGLVGAPLVLPWLVIGIAALLFFSQLQKIMPFFHLSLRTVVATQIICTFPLVTAIVSAQLFRFQRAQEEAAIDMGASRLQVLRYVILPHIAPALAASAIFAYTWSFNNFEISFFTIGFQEVFPTWVYGTVRNSEHLPTVNAISTLISVLQVLLIYLAYRIMASRGEDEAVSAITGAEALSASDSRAA
jgi:spermidine/putrescine transport system permease protein